MKEARNCSQKYTLYLKIIITKKKQKIEPTLLVSLKNITKKRYFFTDVNECQEQTHNCGINSMCNNTIGLYLCTCLQGYSGDGMECYGMVIDLKCSSITRENLTQEICILLMVLAILYHLMGLERLKREDFVVNFNK